MRNIAIVGMILALLVGAGILVGQGGRPVGSFSTPSTINIMDYGASPAAAAAANTTAIHNAIDAMAAGDTLLIPAHTFPVTQVVFDPPNHCRLDCRGVLAPAPAAGAGVAIGDATGAGQKMFYKIKGLKVIPSGASYPWTKDFVGVRLINLMYCDLDVFYVENCWTGLQVTATDSLFTMHNVVHVNKIVDCYENMQIENNVGGALGGGGQVLNNTFKDGKLLNGTLADKIGFSIQCTAVGTCTMTIAGNVLTTDASEGGVTDFNLDLTQAANDTIGEIIAIIDADGDYTCTINANAETSWRTVQLTPVAAVDILTAAYDTAIDGQEGCTGLIITHDGVNAVTSNTLDNFYVSTGTLTQGFTLAGTSNYLRNFYPDITRIEGMSLTANATSNILEMPYAGLPSLVDGGTTSKIIYTDSTKIGSSSVFLGDAVTTTGNYYVFTAHKKCRVTAVHLVSSTTVAANDANYYEAQVANLTHAGNLLSAAKSTKVTGGTAMTQHVAWVMTPDQNAELVTGDVLQIQFTETLAPTDPTGVIVVVHYIICE